MPEGDTIHRAAERLRDALGGREIETADAPNPRSPLHGRVARLAGTTLTRVDARGKHLLAYFSNGQVLHSHLGMNGRFRVNVGSPPPRNPWLLLIAGDVSAAQTGAKILRLVSERRIRSDTSLNRLGPDPLADDYDHEHAVRVLRERGAGRELGDALLDQRIIAGSGNAIRNEASYIARLDPWRKVDELSPEELEAVVSATESVMYESMRRGRRPRSIYRANIRGGCPGCGGPVRSRGQGDENRTAYWCPRCQR